RQGSKLGGGGQGLLGARTGALIGQSIHGVTRAAQSTRSGAQETLTAATELASLSGELRQAVDALSD
ncbi:MAG: hypothetical protein AAF211_02360, partial [Myxococcota bacterium]